VHDERDQALLKEILFWSSIYHYKDTFVRILLPTSASRDFWRRCFGVQTFPAVVLADDPSIPSKFIVFSSTLFDEEPFRDPKKLVSVLDFCHDRLMDGGTVDDLRRRQVLQRLSEVTLVALERLTRLLVFSGFPGSP